MASQKELQAGLSQNQAAAESKDKWSRSASFWDRSLDMGKLKKVLCPVLGSCWTWPGDQYAKPAILGKA